MLTNVVSFIKICRYFLLYEQIKLCSKVGSTQSSKRCGSCKIDCKIQFGCLKKIHLLVNYKNLNDNYCKSRHKIRMLKYLPTTIHGWHFFLRVESNTAELHVCRGFGFNPNRVIELHANNWIIKISKLSVCTGRSVHWLIKLYLNCMMTLALQG